MDFTELSRLALMLACALGVCAIGCAEGVVISDTRPEGSPNRAAWMAKGTYGVMVHYLLQPKGDTPEARTADLNRMVDKFDVDAFVAQFQATRADWLILTLGQGTGFLSSPNLLLAKDAAGNMPNRDVPLEIAQRLGALGKKLILYLPSGAQADPLVKRVLRFGEDGYFERYNEFVRAYAVKFGKRYHGWWFDGCGPQPDESWRAWMDAARAGNPEAAIAFSGAEFCGGGPLDPVCKLEDYHAGEIHLVEDGKIRRDFLPPGGDIVVNSDRKLRKRGQEAQFYLPDTQFIDGVQWHCLLPSDLTFNPAIPNQFCHYTDKELFQFVRAVKAVGGAITINVPLDHDAEAGRIPTDSHAQLVRLGEALGR
ncbi:MAG: hypothetical protein COZ06_32840 [Armatimonadetes bacterium CG_4_10_14_3_um_filter_66_18]|nr:hypothetical protein [Armatimonadota bacterium]OIO95602.1 MAG: hypothetical protein AUJ96_26410 [Armatimonadetes bacterium CG2_30_66_41]PIU94988.1 MAG: hypothetical protein COS65_04755 [Armatimonadetes bacterium CG06_land_8_20_14_3_00_66_21]PIX49760.1 MAG: hypothetical protein COZ57_02400 [Armatimonadetes bacterium CG_4_8_14_3_um_filter_66_20]PIY37482.1 MAG: hypothetical protein COZ06_32840 [Armatimonadetes bacterium CG_4_10_14_3_um_filter_66_18]PIZ44682.1 MAG: hypothetical protein COY42_13